MPKAKPSPLGFPKPHPYAFVADKPCWNCGYDWLRPCVDLSNPEAEEIPLVNRCARCKHDPESSREEVLARLNEKAK